MQSHPRRLFFLQFSDISVTKYLFMFFVMFMFCLRIFSLSDVNRQTHGFDIKMTQFWQRALDLLGGSQLPKIGKGQLSLPSLRGR